ncbi:NAD(P)/FAD-dependent oxidoreductase [Microlunatus panaciterrae]
MIIIGGGHNGLVAASYLARAGRSVTVLEARDTLGGAVASAQVFDGVDARLSRFSYLVSVLPQSIIDDLGLDLELRSRPVASYTPVGEGGVLVEREEGAATRESFTAATGDDADYEAWRQLEQAIKEFAAVVAPTLTSPLPRASELRRRVDPQLWRSLVERPIGELLESTLTDDTLRGILLTDALIGIFTRAHDASLRQNRCFLYHVIGNGTGEWKVPVGGMGAVAAALHRAAVAAGTTLRTKAAVTALTPDPAGGGTVRIADGSELHARHVLVNCAPAVLARLLGSNDDEEPEGSQTKINIVVRRLPRFRSGIDPRIGFAGTLHLGQGYGRLEAAYAEAEAGQIPDPVPCEVYCHSLTDPSILSPELQRAGYHTLTLFGLHTPARLFRSDPDGAREEVRTKALGSLQQVLAEPLDDCLAVDAQGQPCVEVMTPLDIEAAVGMPGGHIFHGDLAWPWLADGAPADTPGKRWGVAIGHPGILLCGSGATRGGAVSGLGGHNAAMAVLDAD